MTNPVVEWFGDAFLQLDPLLQALHRDGGQLSGTVDIRIARGLAGVLGRRLARRLGLPPQAGPVPLEVNIAHDGRALHWARTFHPGHRMVSVFVPHGRYPEGCWHETTGPLKLKLGVDLQQGGWFWVQREVRLLGLPLPLWLFPASRAYKRVVDGRYEFSVSFTVPVLGELLGYGGLLEPRPAGAAR